MLMADAVSRLASRTPGKEAVAMEAYAKALRQVRFIFYFFYFCSPDLTSIICTTNMATVTIN